MIIHNAHIITPSGIMRWLAFEGGKITAMGDKNPPLNALDLIDGHNMTLLPGFIDLHIHGSAGHDVMDATPEALLGIARFVVRYGVTAFLPTTLTDSRARTQAALENIRAHMGRIDGGASIIGAHLEGPYLNIEKCGAQNPEYIRIPHPDEALAFLAVGILRLVDVAPEISETAWLIDECVRRGITVSAAHTSASATDIARAVERGLTHSTHTYNAQSPLNHREPGVVGAVLANPAIRCELIADGIHVHPLAMRIAWLCKKSAGLILISDAIRAAGMPEGTYQFDDRSVLLKDGAVRLLDGTLAGSALTMDRALRNFMDATGEPLENIWQTTSLNAAKAIGVADRKGSIEIGKDADLVLLDDSGAVQITIVEGDIAFRAANDSTTHS